MERRSEEKRSLRVGVPALAVAQNMHPITILHKVEVLAGELDLESIVSFWSDGREEW